MTCPDFEVMPIGSKARLAELEDKVGKLLAHVGEQVTFAKTRIQDGKDLGATVWRIALEDIAREDHDLLAELVPVQNPAMEQTV